MTQPISKVAQLRPDDKNANKGSRRGRDTVAKSLQRFGAGRSILIDRDGRIIAGNKTVEQATALGVDDLIVVQTDGSKLVAVQRTDLSLDDAKARGLAIADNRTAQLGLEWNPETLSELSADLDLKPFFTANELSESCGEPPQANDPNAEYVGMPAYSSEDKTAVRDIIIHFRDEADVREFAKLLGQNISDKTKYVWFPKEENADLASYKYE